MGSVGEVLPSRYSTRIVRHTFDAAKIGIISESCKYFAFYFHFFSRKGSWGQGSWVLLIFFQIK